MKQIKRMICLFVLLVTVMMLIPGRAEAMSVTAPNQSVTSTKYFTALPGVYEMGDGYAVIWATNFSGTGYIKYTYQGKQYTVYD